MAVALSAWFALVMNWRLQSRRQLFPCYNNIKMCSAFEPSEMSGLAPDVMQHRLNVDSSHKPVIQKR